MNDLTVDSIIRETIRKGGGTFHGNGAEVLRSDGYAVGMSRGTYLQIALEDSDLLAEGIKMVAKRFEGFLIGTWVHNGEIYIDPVFIFDNKDMAIKVGRHYDQKAIYDLAAKKEIFI